MAIPPEKDETLSRPPGPEHKQTGFLPDSPVRPFSGQR